MAKKIFLLLLLFGLYSCKKESNTKVLYLAHNLPQSHPVHKGFLAFQKALSKKSGAKLTIKIFSDGQLGSEREVLELLQIGTIAITKVSAATLANFVPEYQVLGVPYLFRDKAHLTNVLEGKIGKSILEKGSKFWLRGLCFYDAGSRNFYTKTKPIRRPEDLKNMKIRVMNNRMSIDMVNAMGGSATPMALGELYTALQQGVVDGAENNLPSFVSTQHYEVCKYLTMDEHSAVPDVLIVSTKYWNKLSDQEKKWLQEAADESSDVQKIYWREADEASLKTVREFGVEVIYPDKSLFADQSKTVLEIFLKEYPRMVPLINQIKAK